MANNREKNEKYLNRIRNQLKEKLREIGVDMRRKQIIHHAIVPLLSWLANVGTIDLSCH